MNMFKVPENGAATPRRTPFIRPAILVFLIALLAGGAAVVWRAVERVHDTQTAARKEAQARASMLELQFQQAISAAEILGVYGKQSAGGIPGFASVAAGLVAARPALAAIELQPAGVVRDVIPRNGNERLIGMNVRTDPAQGPGVAVAIQRRTLTISAPVPLRGGQGLIVRVPLYERTRSGTESFWGLVAVSMRFQDAFGWARVDDVYRSGYNYAFFPPSAGGAKPSPLLWRGSVEAAGAVQQTVRAGNLEFRLALEPREGWFSFWTAGWEAFLALLLAGLLCAVVNLFESRRSLEEALDETRERLSQETRSSGQAQQEARTAKDAQSRSQADLDRSTAALREAEARHVETQALTEQSLHKFRQEATELSEQLTSAQKLTSELQVQLEDARKAQQEELRKGENAARASAAALKAAAEENRELNARIQRLLEAQQESDSRAKAQSARDAAALVEIQRQLDSANQSAVAIATMQAKAIATLESRLLEREVRLAELEPYQKQAGDLALTLARTNSELLAAQTALKHSASAAKMPGTAPTEEPDDNGNGADASRPEKPELTPSALLTTAPPAETDPGDVPSDDVAGEVALPVVTPELERKGREAAEEQPSASLPVVQSEPVVAPEMIESPAAVAPPTTQEPETGTPPGTKTPRRKKSKRDDQMDFFAAPPALPEGAPVESPSPDPATPALESDTSAQEEAELDEELNAAVEVSSAIEESEFPLTPEVITAPHFSGDRVPSRGELSPTAEPEPGQPLDLPVIEGLVSAEGLAWADGNPRAYLEKLRHYVDHHATSAIKIRNALERGESDEASRVTRALKTESGEIGAVAVNGAAASLERAVHDRHEPGDIELLWAELEAALSALMRDLKPIVRVVADKPAAPRAAQPPTVNVPSLRKAVGAIVPLLTDGDPGAKDCWKDNQAIFRSAFAHDGHVDFERSVNSGEFPAALEALKKAVRKHGISI
jgi:HPt (histidine-containing phosphotransfer) domain-containing protein